jgi:acyl-CoA reductase-like NAD-dependent aldehyde dehydrogenase
MSTATPTEARRLGHFIDGEQHAGAGDAFERHSPATGELVAAVAAGTASDVDAAVAAARAAFDHGPWPRTTAPERARVLRRLAALVEEHAEELAALDSEEVGKPLRLARVDIAGAVANIEYAASLAHTLHGESWTDYDPDVVAYTLQAPAGVAALVIPWNFPALIVAQKLPFALAAGCTVVVKPSEFTSSSALRIAELASEAGVPAGAVNVVTGRGPDVGAPLAAHPDVDVISFTGSTVTGRAVMTAAAQGLKRVSLELGGKGANVVFADADLDEVADAVVFAAFFNQGECCVAGTRLIAARSVQDELLERVVQRARRLVVGDPRADATDVGPLIHAGHLERVSSYLDGAVRDGAETLLGGGRPEVAGCERGHFVEPTIFGDVSPDSALFQEEVFGPVLAVTPFDEPDEAAALANATPYGLANSVWTSNVATAHRVARLVRSGTVWVNTTIDGTSAIAFGGTKASGFGREVGREGLLEFTELKSVQVRTARRGVALTQDDPAPTAA